MHAQRKSYTPLWFPPYRPEDCRTAPQTGSYLGFASRVLYNPQSSTHDMNKSLPAAPSGMYQQNSGAIPGQAPQHQQAGMGGPSPTAAMVQGQQGMSHRGHMQNMANFQQRNNPPQMASINRPPMGNIVPHNSQQGSQPYHQSVHNVVLPSHAQGYQQMIFSQLPTAAIFQQRTMQYPPMQQYHQMYATPYSYNTAPAPNPAAYFQVQPHMQTCPPAVNNMPPPSQPTQHSKRDRKILSIIHPETGKNVMEEFDNDSSRDSSRSTSMHTSRESSRTGSSDPAVCSLFAAQVAAAAVGTKTESLDPELKTIEDPRPIIIQSESLNMLETPNDSGNDQIPAAIICDPFLGKEEEESMLELENTSVPFSKTDILDSNTISDNIQITSDSNEDISFVEPVVKESYNLINHDSCNSVKESPPQEEYPTPSQDKLEEPIVLPEVTQIFNQEQLVEVTIASDEGKVEVESNVNCIEETTNVEQVDEVPPVCPSPPTEVHAVGDKTIEESAASKAEKAAEGKKSKGKKKKDINRKGESKEGSEMDAFLEVVDAKPLSPASIPSPPVSVPEEIPQPTSPASPVSIVNHEIPDSAPVSTEFSNTVEIDSPEILKEAILPNEEPEDVTETDVSLVSDTTQEVSKPALKYNYKEDQWSPLNPEGKKHYDREFLLQMQSQPMSLKKPSNLPDLDVIKDKAQLYKLSDVNRAPIAPNQARSYDPFIPQFARGGPPRPSPHGINRRSQQGRDKPKKVISFSSSLNQTVKLHESSNAWKPQMVKPDPDNEEEVKNQEVYKKVRGILNKLTPQKFDTLVKQVKDLEINTEERLKTVIDLVFEKAIDEPNFSVPYASMCKQLALLKVPFAEQEGFVNFRKLLLTKCQKEFEQDNRDELKRIEKMKLIKDETEEKKKQLTEEFAEEERKNRRRQLGNIRFIGELFKFGMLTEMIMHECVSKLLRQGDEDSLECLCRLLTTIGKELETRKEKMTQEDFNIKKSVMNNYMTEMQKVVDKRQTSSRVRFMLQDVIDLRRTMWKPRRNDDNPKTIDQIHKEAEREAHEQQQLLQSMPFSNKRPPDDRKRNSGRNPTNYEQDGWITTNKNTKMNYSVDPTKLQFKPAQSDTIQLGPAKGFFNWARGSGGAPKPTPEIEKVVQQTGALLTNRYSPLSSDQQQPPAQSYDDRRNSQRSAASSRESSRGRNNQLPPQSLRKTPSTSKERENALETVSRFTRPGQPEQKPVEPKVPNLTSVNGKDTAVTSLKGPELSEEEIEKKVRPLLDELTINEDLVEAVRCITELASPSTIHLVITAAINHVLERSSQARSVLGQLLHKLVQSKLIGLEEYNKGLIFILELVDDYALDIPLIWEYLGDIMAPMLDGTDIPISFLEETLRPCCPSLTAGKLVAATLRCALKSKTSGKLGEMWRESGLLWSNFLPPSNDVSQFIKANAVEFTVSETIAEPITAEMPTAAEIQTKLDFYLKNDSQNNEQILDWIESHIGPNTSKATFIRALVTAVYENAISGSVEKCELNTEKLKLRMPLLQHHVAHKEEAELQALYALQALILRLNQPKGILNQIFDTSYDEDVISEETFYKWETSNDPAEQEGKGVAVNSVGSFFTWLREADNETSAEDG